MSTPPRTRPRRGSPRATTQVYADGSGAWTQFEEMRFFTTWQPGLNRVVLFTQTDLGGVLPDANTEAATYR